MQFKIEIDGEETLYSFESGTEVKIGRSPDSDIQVLVEGISRNHAKVIERNDEFIYTDLGSSVGSFVNDEPLQANVPTVFNSFFPIRLGQNVYLYLVDEVIESPDTSLNLDDIPDAPLDDTPEPLVPPEPKPKKKSHKPMIYVPESAGTITKEASKVLEKNTNMSPQNRRKKVVRKSSKKANVRKNSDVTQRVLFFLLFAIVIGFFGYKKWEKIEQEKFEKLKVELEKKKAEEKAKQEELERLKKIAKEKELEEKKKERLSFVRDVIFLDKCLGEVESKLCSPLKTFSNRSLREGYYKTLSDLYLILDVQSTFNNLSRFQYTYSEQEKASLFELLAKEVKGGVHLGYFENQKNLLLSEHIHSPEEYKLFLFSDFILSGSLKVSKEISGINSLTIVGMNLNEYTLHLQLDFKKLQKLNLEEAQFMAKVFIRSNIKKPLYQLIDSLKYTPKDSALDEESSL